MDWVFIFLISLAWGWLDDLGVLSMTFWSWPLVSMILIPLTMLFFLPMLSTTSLHSRQILIWLVAFADDAEFPTGTVELELLPIELNFDVHPNFWLFSNSFWVEYDSSPLLYRGIPKAWSDDGIFWWGRPGTRDVMVLDLRNRTLWCYKISHWINLTLNIWS